MSCELLLPGCVAYLHPDAFAPEMGVGTCGVGIVDALSPIRIRFCKHNLHGRYVAAAWQEVTGDRFLWLNRHLDLTAEVERAGHRSHGGIGHPDEILRGKDLEGCDTVRCVCLEGYLYRRARPVGYPGDSPADLPILRHFQAHGWQPCVGILTNVTNELCVTDSFTTSCRLGSAAAAKGQSCATILTLNLVCAHR